MTKQKLWGLIEAYRTSGGREEHHARKERLDAVLDELLEQPAQQRVEELLDIFKDVDQCGPLLGMGQPAQRKPLTDHQTMSMTFNHHWLTSMTLRDAYRLGIRDAEAAHGITKGTK